MTAYFVAAPIAPPELHDKPGAVLFTDAKDLREILPLTTIPEGGSLAYEWKEGAILLGTSAVLNVSRPSGTYTFTLKVTDPTGLSDTDTVQVKILVERNVVPDANDQALSTKKNTAKSLTLSGYDPDGDSLTYAIVSGPSHGTLTGSGANRTYTPTSGYVGDDSFSFRATDPYGASSTDTVSITVYYDVTSKVSVTPVLVSPGSLPGSINYTVLITNDGSTTLNGPISLILTSYSLSNATGTTSRITPLYRPYINTTVNSLVAGASTILTLQFTKTATGTLSFSIQVVAGPGTR